MTVLQHLHPRAAEAIGLGLGLGLSLRPAEVAAWGLAVVAVALFLAPTVPRLWGRLARPRKPQGQGTPPVLNLANLVNAVEQLKAVVADGRAVIDHLKTVEPAVAVAVADLETIGVELARFFAAMAPLTNVPVAPVPAPDTHASVPVAHASVPDAHAPVPTPIA
jgi:hypothetical protein